MQALAESLRAAPLFYIRNHFDVPGLGAASWRLPVDGVVEHPLGFSVKDLQTLPERTAIVTLECAGNGRTRMNSVPPGTPWAYGAVGTARFTGTPLHLLLDQAGVGAETIEVVFTGADQGEVEPGRVTRFARSLPLDVARHPDTLMAWAMNGEPLPLQHGFPLRLIVPRWYGMASVKWARRDHRLSRPFEGYFQRESYAYAGERGDSGRNTGDPREGSGGSDGRPMDRRCHWDRWRWPGRRGREPDQSAASR
jgi:DMSO/TMAO reductase YedYZ molybdopterin-dependent catalytic subunit